MAMIAESPPSKEEGQPSSSGGAWWVNLLSSTNNVFACSACLGQVEWVEADADAANETTALLRQEDHSSVKDIEQQHPPDSCGRNGDDVNLNSSLMDEDSNQSSNQMTEDVHNITLDLAIEPYDEQLRSSSSLINNHAIVTSPRDQGDHSSTVGEFGSCTSEASYDDETLGDECPICLNLMSNADLMYPLQCPGTNCAYNFCLQCMSSLVTSSKDAYQMASDGSLRVKVHLNCPNCRANIKGIIEDAICRRQEILAHQMIDDALDDSRLIITAFKSIQDKIESREFLDNKASMSRLKNRARAPSWIRHKRKNDLIMELNSIPTPSLVRDQVLAAHLHTGLFAASSSDSDRTLRVPSVPIFSSTISHPFYSSTTIRPLNAELKGCPLRRSKSFELNIGSPTSIMDEAFWTGEAGQHGSSSTEYIHRSQKEEYCGGLTTGIKDGFLVSSLDLEWCCSSYDVNTSNIMEISGSARKKSKSEEGCGGYVDYLGTYHECTANRYALEPCHGCVFHRGTYSGEDKIYHEEMYYDSDCGQQFAVGTWTSATRHHHADDASLSLSEASSSTHSSAPKSAREKAKSLWMQRRNRQHARSESDIISSPSPQKRITRSHSDVTLSLYDRGRQQYQVSPLRIKSPQISPTKPFDDANMYDYFSQGGSPMRTGFFSTNQAEIGNYVQDALNSRWRLDWHHVAPKGNSALLHRQPKACEVWIERGYRRNHTEIVEPKLMWRELSQPGLQQGVLTDSTMNPYRASLFAIRRIVPVADGDDWQRMCFDDQTPCQMNAWKPMAKPNCLIAVRSSVGQDYLFEASCPEERDRIVHLWKMTTARLVSHAVAGNICMMMEEFFNEAAISGGVYASILR